MRILRPSLALVALAAVLVLLGLAVAGPAPAATASPSRRPRRRPGLRARRDAARRDRARRRAPRSSSGTTSSCRRAPRCRRWSCSAGTSPSRAPVTDAVVAFGGDVVDQRHRRRVDGGLRRRRHPRSRRRRGQQPAAVRRVPRPVRRQADAGAGRPGRRPGPDLRRAGLGRGGQLGREELLHQPDGGASASGAGSSRRRSSWCSPSWPRRSCRVSCAGCSGISAAKPWASLGWGALTLLHRRAGDPGRAW